jgi:2-polyprenyl-6-methoxyphenol hydroxylase-like FAD-dependent oxidoreductase
MADGQRVVIVGAGPVGAGLALELGLRGVRCAIVERRIGLGSIPKGQNLTQRSFEHFWSWGVAERVRAAAVMPPGGATGMVTVYGDLLAEHWLAPPGREAVRDYYLQENGRLPQYRTERVLRERIAEVEPIDALFGWNAVEIGQDAEGVRVLVEKEGERKVLRGDFLVGCDGGRSLVRENGGIARHGTDFDALMALVVFRSPELDRILRRFPEQATYRVMHPDLRGFWRFFGRVDPASGFFFHAPVPRAAAADLDIRRVLHEAAGVEFACDIEHTGSWDLRVRIADSYRSGRVFLAGDAAHTHPPYGGFGLNTGLEDAVNLGWKLSAVLDGWAGDALLDSYTAERRAVVDDIAENVIAATIRQEAAFLEAHDPGRDGDGFAVGLRTLLGETAARLREVEPHYEGSPVVFGPAGGACGARGAHSFAARAGHHLAPGPLSNGRDVFAELGRGFTLLALDADPAGFAAAAEVVRLPLTVVRDTRNGPLGRYGAGLVLVRPDQYVAWVSDEAPADAAGILRRVAGNRAIA